MGVKKKEPAQAVVMSSTKRFGKRQVAGLALVIVLLVGAGGITAFLLLNKDKAKDASDKPKTTAEVLTDSADLQYTEGKDAAVRLTSEAFENASSQDDKFALAEQTGAVYEGSQDYNKAIEWYKKADEIKPNQRGPLGGLARCYKATGDKAKAIEYLEKVLKHVDFSGRHGTQNDKAYYEYELEQLKKGQ